MNDDGDSTRVNDPSLLTLSGLFNERTWERGERYAADKRVRSLDVSLDPNASPGWTVDARVLGTALYEVWVDLGRDDQGQWHLSSGCTCPVGYRCKHQAAVINRLVTERQDMVPFFPENRTPKPLAPAWAAILPQLAAASNAAGSTAGRAAPPTAPPAVAPAPAPVVMAAPPEPPAPPPPPLRPLVSSPLDLYALQWLGELNRLHAQDAPNATPADEVIFFELGELPAHPIHGHRLTLMPAKAKRLKQNNLPGKLHTGNQSLRRTLANRDDAELRALLDGLEAMTHFSGSHWDTLPWGVLTSALAEPTLRRALATGRVVSRLPDNMPSAPWHWGEPRSLGWQWEAEPLPDNGATEDERCWRMRPAVLPLPPSFTNADASDAQGSASPDVQASETAPAPNTAQAFISSVSFYRDEAQRCVGQLRLEGCTWQQALQWQKAPPLRQAWLKSRRELRQLLPSLPESVAEPVARRIRGQAPVPVLCLSWLPPDRSAHQAQHPVEIELLFDYAGVRGYWGKDAPLQHFLQRAEGLVELVREPLLEEQARQRLNLFALPAMEASFTFRPPHNLWYLGGPKRPNPIALLAGWLAQDFAPLREQGFEIELAQEWQERTREVQNIDADLGEGEGGPGWLSLSLGFVMDGKRFNLLPLLPQILAGLKTGPGGGLDAQSLPERLWLYTEDGQWWSLPSAPLRPWLDMLIELLGDRPKDFAADKLKLSPMDALRMGADAANFGHDAHGALRDVIAPTLPDASLAALPTGLKATPRPYQHQGFAWLRALAQHHLGGVLADDMGLGKTLQTITHLLDEKQRGRSTQPSLVVAPTSLVGNWRRECLRFAPELRLLVLHGSSRHEHQASIPEHDVVLTTYPLLHRDIELLEKQSWHALVMDEAQTLKNAHTQTAQAARKLKASHRIALTGTPMENHLGELWSLFDLVLPGYLGREARFATLFRTPIEKHSDSRRLALLRRRISPFMLRRDKSMVATELPPKIEQVLRVQLGEAQANLYETIRAAAESTVREALASKGLARSQITVLDALLKLRQVCCDPHLVKLQQARKINASAKLEWLMENLPQMVEEGRKVLLFSQFTSMLDLIGTALNKAHLPWTTLTGDTRDREAAIERFTSGEVPIFLISLKAGGTGLNLPQADTVIHYDPWWNPAVENQATDRAHRMGQTQTVFVYKLVAEGTLEERILAMQARKADLARGVQSDAGMQDRPAALSSQDLDWLLQPLSAVTAADEDAVAQETRPSLRSFSADALLDVSALEDVSDAVVLHEATH
jgi:superfamily II DNA or RNA helicase